MVLIKELQPIVINYTLDTSLDWNCDTVPFHIELDYNEIRLATPDTMWQVPRLEGQ